MGWLYERSRRRQFTAAAASMLTITPLWAADAPLTGDPGSQAPVASTPIDAIFGARLQSDYNFRGISQSNLKPSPQAYGELQILDNLFYAGVAGYRVDLPTKPQVELDLTAGVRPKVGPFTFDLGTIYYLYPDERPLGTTFTTPGGGTFQGPPFLTPANTDFLELAGKVAYTHADALTLGGNVFGAYDWLGSGAPAVYSSATARYVIPDTTFPASIGSLALSGEFGRYTLGRTSPQLGRVQLPDYLYWNAGVALTVKNATLDLRYHDTNLDRSECFTLTTDPKGLATGSNRSNWCQATFIASLSFDFQASKLGVFAPATPSAPPKESGAGGVPIR